jgi:pimeloyl-ACP methyl ester carboxylesterase
MKKQKVLLSVVVLVFILIGSGLVAGTKARADLKVKYPPIGEMVDVGGYRLHLYCQGTGSPTVVIEAGQGDFGLSWSLVQPELAQTSRVCVYDRAGLGWSDPSPRPRTLETMVDELHTLLTNAGIPGPYVLVGHSLGGMAVRLYAHHYSQDVAAMVLVDSSHEDQFAPEPIQKALRQMTRLMPLMYGYMQTVVGSGAAALMPALLPDPAGVQALLPLLPPQSAEIYRSLIVSDPKLLAAASGELQALPESQAQMRAAQITSLGDIPLIVLRHGQTQPMMATAEVAQLLEETFVQLQNEMAALSSNGRVVVAEQSGHVIHIEQPDLVIEAVQQVLAEVRN